MISVREVPASDVWRLRHEIMWPDKPYSFVQLPKDHEGTHLGLFVDDKLVSVLSLFDEDGSMQFRKFCTLPAYQNHGYGSRLLECAIYYARKNHENEIWCDARSEKTGFYEKFGLEPSGEAFERNGRMYQKVVLKL